MKRVLKMLAWGLGVPLFLLIPMQAGAQPGPIYFVEHDWTIRVGGARFGLYQDRLLGDENYGAGRHTTLYFGPATLRANTRNFQSSTWAVVSLGGVALCLLCILKRSGAAMAPGEQKN